MEFFSEALVAMFIAITSIAVSRRRIGRFPVASREGKYIRGLGTTLISSPAVALYLVLGLVAPNAAAQINNIGLAIHVFNVGQGDSTLVIGPPPQHKTLLIDMGEELTGTRTHYKDIAAKLKTLIPNKKTIDYFVISHYHFDHIGTNLKTRQGSVGLWGLLDVEGYRIAKLVDRGDAVQIGPPTGPEDKLHQQIGAWLTSGAIKQRETAHLGTDQIDLGDKVIVEIVAVNGNGILEKVNQNNPTKFVRCPPSENDFSVALKISQGDFEYFTGGDLAGQNTSRQFGATCTSYNNVETSIASKVGNVEVMKINHHGSLYSSNSLFLKTLAPEFMIVTSGARNRYQHPSRQAMDRATKVGAVLITGGLSEKEWPGGSLLPGMQLVEDGVDILVEAGGRKYEILGVVHPSFSDVDEQKGLDRAHARDVVNKLNREHQ